MAIGGLALTRRQWQQAEAAFATAAEMDPQLTESWIMQARLRAASGNLDGAAAALESGLKARPRHVDVMAELAGVELQRGKPEAAIGLYRRALEIDRQRSDLWLSLGVAALSARDLNGALEAAASATQIDPKAAEPHVLSALAYVSLGDTARAREAARTARQLDPAIALPTEVEALLN
jgi:tetratricopeptide (TPR) repeat protein